jgi:DNA-binding transcriptional MerR regulator
VNTPSEPETGYTIDELAALTGVPSRTIRFYQASGALPPPVRRGRQAFYDESHVERLKLVAELQDRGLNLKAIRDLVGRADAGELSVSEWLGVGDQIRAPWSDDQPRIHSEEELKARLGAAARPGLLTQLVRAGLVQREGHARPPSYLVPSPALLDMALELDAAGIELDDAVAGLSILRKRLSRAADELAGLMEQRARSRDSKPEDLSRALDTLRSVGVQAVRLVFAQEMERSLRELFERGRAMPRRRQR